MMYNLLFSLAMALSTAQPMAAAEPADTSQTVALADIRVSDPCILADPVTHLYYMTGTGGLLWKSPDLKRWTGPFRVAQPDSSSWMGPNPMIWAAELHRYQGKYYYFATFTNEAVKIDTVAGNVIDRRASHVLVSDKAEGPYRPMRDKTYLPASKPTLDGTFWVDADGKPYMVYCWEWLQNGNGTVDKIELKADLSGSIGEGKTLFRASDSPWSREMVDGRVRPQQGDRRPLALPHWHGSAGHALDQLGDGRLYTGRGLLAERHARRPLAPGAGSDNASQLRPRHAFPDL